MPLLVHFSAAQVPAPSLRVEAIVVIGGEVCGRAGRLVMRSGRSYVIELDDADLSPSLFVEGVRVILDVRGPKPRRVICGVESQIGRRVTLAERALIKPENRMHPRSWGAIDLKFRSLRADEDNVWRTPDPFMNFSVNGFSFGTPDGVVHEGDLLELSFTVPGFPMTHRAVARVLSLRARTTLEMDDAAADETEQLGCEIIEQSALSREALAAFTLRIQRGVTDRM